jgi:outer membrane protein insertion porin family
VLVVEVVEKSTGSINFSVGYSTTEYVIGSISLQERNFLGKGYNVRDQHHGSFKRQNVDFGFTNPYFMGMPISAGIDVFATNTDNRMNRPMTSEQIGFALRTGFRVDEYSNINFRYGLTWRASMASQEQRLSRRDRNGGRNDQVLRRVGYTWDNLDNPVRPTNGFRGQLVGDIAGLGGDVYFGSIEAHGWYFYPLYEEKVVLKIEGNAGHVQPIGDNDVPLQDRFFKGADSFRGFAVSGVGPRQRGNDGDTDSIGGTHLCHRHGRSELPARHPRGMGHRRCGVQRLRHDLQSGVRCWRDKAIQSRAVRRLQNRPRCKVFDTAEFRASVGAGIIWQSPFGPLRFEACLSDPEGGLRREEWFRFSVGTRF